MKIEFMYPIQIEFPDDIYRKYLKKISGINFTCREIDVTSFLTSGRSAKKTASFLLISPKTVEYHTSKIMQKLACNSRESIIDFIEKSQKLPILRQYYSSLVVNSAFKKILIEVSKIKHKQVLSNLIVYWHDQDLKNVLLGHLKHHLEQAGLIVDIQERNFSIKRKDLVNSNHISLTLLKKDNQEYPQKLDDFNSIELSKNQNYYFYVFEILKKLLPDTNLEVMYLHFKEQYESIYDPSFKAFAKNFVKDDPKESISLIYNAVKAHKWRFSSVLAIIGLVGIGLLVFNDHIENLFQKQNVKDASIRSDLIIPGEAALLDRPTLINKLDQTLKAKRGIQMVALVGVGGAGKTILARQYARRQKLPIIWEVNAETRESLRQSFEDLAFYLSKTNEDKSLLKEIKEIKNPHEKEKKIVFFTSKRLSALPDWLVIYDNVEAFQSIQYFFPNNELQWGKGKVIITTRDKNISNSSYINPEHVIHIQDLTADEKYELFTRIFYGQKAKKLTNFQKKETETFLKKLPSFPLDILAAAYYLKDVKTSFQEYIERTQELSDDFEQAQESLLIEISNYTKTRYGIVTLAIEKLIYEHPDFKDLLLAISLMDSQNIPLELLKKYKPRLVVERFIHALRKNSFITAETSLVGLEVFSLHRSIQEIIFAYLVKSLSLEKKKEILLPFLISTDEYTCEVIWKEDINKMKLLMRHLFSFFKHSDFIPSIAKGYVYSNLGSIYNYLGDYEKSKKYHKESLFCLEQHVTKYPSKVAWAMEQLAEVYSELGKYQNAIQLFENSLLLYQKEYSKNRTHIARATSNVGYVYKEIGDYNRSLKLLEKSLNLYETYDPRNYVGIAWTLLYLGYLYQDIGKYQKARDFYEKSLTICKKNLPKYHMLNAWILSHLGNIYGELENRENTESLINQARSICKLHFSENHVGFAVILSHLGNHYAALKNYNKAKEYYKKSYSIYRKHYSEDHVRIARVMRDLGKVSLLEEKCEEGTDFLNNALRLFEKNKHSEIYSVFEGLAELSFKKFLNAQAKGNYVKAQKLKKQTMYYLLKAFETLNLRFPKDSPHILRIQLKLKKFEKLEKE